MAPPTAAVEARKSRRFMSVCTAFLDAVIIGPPRSRLQLGRAMDRRPNAGIGPAAADVRHCVIDVSIGRLRLVPEQRDGSHNLPRLAISALRDTAPIFRAREFEGIAQHPQQGGVRLHVYSTCDSVHDN